MEPQQHQQAPQAPFTRENEIAEGHIESGNLPLAAQVLVDIVEKDPKNYRAFNNMGIISWERKSWEDAYATFKHACELKPDYADALINLFDAALKLRRLGQTLPVFKQAHELAPENSEIAVLLESIETQGDDIYSSQRALHVGVYNPRLEEAHNLLESSQLNAAMEKYLDLVDTEGPHAEAFNGLGIISFYQKRYKDAFSLFYESIKLNPKDTDTYLNFVDAAKECGQTEDAKKIFAMYCAEFPEIKKIEDEFNRIALS